MKRLNDNWLTEGTLDFELKKYVLLDFVQQTDKAFQQVKLYPALSELIRHHSSLQVLKEQKTNAINSFPQALLGFDPFTFKAQLEKHNYDNQMLNDIMEIIDYAIPIFRSHIQDGQDIYNFIERQLKLEPIGVEPLNMDEGYLFLHDSGGQDVIIYRYGLSVIESSNERYRALKTEVLGRERRTLTRSFDQIKLGLIKKFKEFPNPSTWLVTTDLSLPLVETFLPITKRLMMQKLHMRS